MRTTDEWQREIGAQLRATRIQADIDQEQLARTAGVSVGAIRNLELGKGSSLATLIRVVRALDRTDWLQALAPQVAVSPLAALAQVRRGQPFARRSRVSRRRSAG